VCWYTGRDLFDAMGGKVPVGLIEAAVGGSPIEYWISPEAIAACEVDQPQCDSNKEDSVFYHEQIVPNFPFALGAVVWDQAERDVKCPHSVAAYLCMQKQLVSTWRHSFNDSPFAFVAVQLPGYTAALKNGTGSYDGGVTAEMVYNMRLAQEAGVQNVERAAIAAIYDLSCPDSPFSSVHTPDKADVGARVARHLRHMILGEDIVVEGPRATGVAITSSNGVRDFLLDVRFQGGSSPFVFQGTRNCTSCCHDTHSVDFDVSADGLTWVNGTNASLLESDSYASVSFHATMPVGVPPRYVRHTAASIWPQCALYNNEGLPALPFYVEVSNRAVDEAIVL